MNASELGRRVDSFLLDTVTQLRAKPFADLQAVPEYPESTKIDLGVPADLLNHKCVFSLMKDTLADGAVRVAIQYHRPGIIIGEMTAKGFIVAADGTFRELSQQDHWDLT
jgi:hypothetical protein